MTYRVALFLFSAAVAGAQQGAYEAELRRRQYEYQQQQLRAQQQVRALPLLQPTPPILRCSRLLRAHAACVCVCGHAPPRVARACLIRRHLR